MIGTPKKVPIISGIPPIHGNYRMNTIHSAEPVRSVHTSESPGVTAGMRNPREPYLKLLAGGEIGIPEGSIVGVNY